MDKITISKGATSVTMPRVRNITVGGIEECVEVEMASGKRVKEMIGFRKKVIAVWDWVPANKMRDLHLMLRQGGYFTVNHPDIDGEGNGVFSISPPESKVFKYRDGEPFWHGVKLTMISQEVE